MLCIRIKAKKLKFKTGSENECETEFIKDAYSVNSNLKEKLNCNKQKITEKQKIDSEKNKEIDFLKSEIESLKAKQKELEHELKIKILECSESKKKSKNSTKEMN